MENERIDHNLTAFWSDLIDLKTKGFSKEQINEILGESEWILNKLMKEIEALK